MIQCVFAVGDTDIHDIHYAFGRNGGLPWGRPIKQDMENFKNRTMGRFRTSAVVMGRNTFESLPKALGLRYNVVVSTDTSKPTPKTKNGDQPNMYVSVNNDGELETLLRDLEKTHDLVSVIGGPSLIEKAIDFADRVIVTYVEHADSREFFEDYDVGFRKDTVFDVHCTFDKKEEHTYYLKDFVLCEAIYDKERS